VDNIKMDLTEIGWGGMDWNYRAQVKDQWRALVNMVMNLQLPLNVGKLLRSGTTGSFSRRVQLHEVSYKCKQNPTQVFRSGEMQKLVCFCKGFLFTACK
jgi:hypothetical protein